MPKSRLPNVPGKLSKKQLKSKYPSLADLEKALKELKTDKHMCLDVVNPLLKLCFKRQAAERTYTAAENEVRRLDALINKELNRLARAVGYTEKRSV